MLSNQDQHHLQPSSSIVLRCVVLCTHKSFPTHSELYLVSLLHLLRSLTHVSWSVTILCRESVTLSGRWIPQRFIARKPNQRSSSSKLCYSYDNSVILNKIAVNPWAAGTSPAKAQVKTSSTSLHTLPLFNPDLKYFPIIAHQRNTETTFLVFQLCLTGAQNKIEKQLDQDTMHYNRRRNGRNNYKHRPVSQWPCHVRWPHAFVSSLKNKHMSQTLNWNSVF